MGIALSFAGSNNVVMHRKSSTILVPQQTRKLFIRSMASRKIYPSKASQRSCAVLLSDMSDDDEDQEFPIPDTPIQKIRKSPFRLPNTPPPGIGTDTPPGIGTDTPPGVTREPRRGAVTIGRAMMGRGVYPDSSRYPTSRPIYPTSRITRIFTRNKTD